MHLSSSLARALAVLCIVSSCGGGSQAAPEPTTGPTQDTPSGDREPGPSRSSPTSGSTESEAQGSRHGFGASPLTPFADAVADVALAAVAGGSASLPASPVPIETSGGDVERLRADAETTAALRQGPPEVLGLYLEVELYLAPTGDADAGPEGGTRRADQLSLGLWLGSRDARVTLLRFVAGGAGAVSLPPPPSAVRRTVERIVTAIREGGSSSAIVFNQADRESVSDPMLGAQMLGGAPRDRAIEPARRALAASPRIRAWAFDDVGVLVRAGGRTMLLAMKITVDDTGLVLEAQPLVRAQTLGAPAHSPFQAPSPRTGLPVRRGSG